MITMGDEIWRTQQGNNNAYCQDNPISWVDWSGVVRPPTAGTDGTDGSVGSHASAPTPAADMLAFVRRVTNLRLHAPALRQGEFFEGRAPAGGDGVADLVWFDETGHPMTDAGWFDNGRKTVQMWLDGRDVRGHNVDGSPMTDHSWLLVLHADVESVEITFPGPPYGQAYSPVVDTGAADGAPADPAPLSAGVEVTLPGRTLWLLRAHRTSDYG